MSNYGESNICRFTPLGSAGEEITTVNFIYETEFSQKGRTFAYYTLNLVLEGEGEYILRGQTHRLRAGDVFVVFPATPCDIASGGDLKCLYVGFIGTRAVRIMDELGIGKSSPVFHGYEKCFGFWRECFDMAKDGSISMLSESVLLYTFAAIGAATGRSDKPVRSEGIVWRINKFINENYGDPELSLRMIAGKLAYNEKYLSTVFKKQMHTDFTDHLTTVRIRQACTLMEEGFTSVKDISRLCGFSEQTYFSKVFKKYLRMTPSEYIRKNNRDPAEKIH